MEQAQKLTVGYTRTLIIDSFIAALRNVTTDHNIRSGFKKGGIYPQDPSIPLTSEYDMPTDFATKGQNFISNQFLNSEENYWNYLKKNINETLHSMTKLQILKNLLNIIGTYKMKMEGRFPIAFMFIAIWGLLIILSYKEFPEKLSY